MGFKQACFISTVLNSRPQFVVIYNIRMAWLTNNTFANFYQIINHAHAHLPSPSCPLSTSTSKCAEQIYLGAITCMSTFHVFQSCPLFPVSFQETSQPFSCTEYWSGLQPSICVIKDMGIPVEKKLKLIIIIWRGLESITIIHDQT